MLFSRAAKYLSIVILLIFFGIAMEDFTKASNHSKSEEFRLFPEFEHSNVNSVRNSFSNLSDEGLKSKYLSIKDNFKFIKSYPLKENEVIEVFEHFVALKEVSWIVSFLFQEDIIVDYSIRLMCKNSKKCSIPSFQPEYFQSESQAKEYLRIRSGEDLTIILEQLESAFKNNTTNSNKNISNDSIKYIFRPPDKLSAILSANKSYKFEISFESGRVIDLK